MNPGAILDHRNGQIIRPIPWVFCLRDSHLLEIHPELRNIKLEKRPYTEVSFNQLTDSLLRKRDSATDDLPQVKEKV